MLTGAFKTPDLYDCYETGLLLIELKLYDKWLIGREFEVLGLEDWEASEVFIEEKIFIKAMRSKICMLRLKQYLIDKHRAYYERH